MSDKPSIYDCQGDSLFTGNPLSTFPLNIVFHIFKFYSGFHIYFLVFFSFFDLFSNILFFIVLSQKELRNSGFNLTMMMIAFCNFNNVVMKLIEEMFDRITGSEKPYFKAFYKRIYAYLKLYLSSMAICLVVEMAFCRVMALYTTHSDKWNGRKYSLVISSVLWITVGLLCSAIIPMYSVTKYNPEEYSFTISNSYLVDECITFRSTLLFFGIIFLFVPCILNFIFFLLIIYKLKSLEESRRKTMRSTKSSNIDNSSRMLKAILIMFLIVNIPQVLILVFHSIYMLDYYLIIAPIISELIQGADVAYASTSFIIYCAISSQFRTVFVRLFVPEVLLRRFNFSKFLQSVLLSLNELFYSGFHVYFLIFFTVLDFFTNTFFIIVLSQKELRNSGINLAMIMIAFCNSSNVIVRLIKAIFERVNGYEKTYVEAVYNRIENYVEVYLTAMSDFLVVEMAFCRVMALYTRDCDKWRGRKYTLVISTVLWIFVGITSGPIIPMTVVKKSEYSERYLMTISDNYIENKCIIFRSTVLFFGVGFGLIPCCLNLIFFLMILWQMKKFEAHRRKTINSMKSSIDNSSRMLQAILIMFLFVKTPQALLLIFNSLFMIDYYILIAPITTQFVEVLDVANSSTSFIFYCIMSSHFREVFVRLFVPEIVQRRMKSVSKRMRFFE
ncbi:hypothetical protein CRE_27278 [Caenorhabditis remanei]|uniref:G-protein coupled receptors family 1 profile domain-containing protein n=1 Tax=Caenorhabditis remanei TaxID=31234 RepID=E3LPF6_CAERE|nr:hypothetical protein CRE_27278 [Caenorhabditis remanei]